MLVEIQPILARRRKGDVRVAAGPDSFASASLALPAEALASLKSGDLNSETRFETLTTSSFVHAFVAGLWALPVAVFLLLSAYGVFRLMCLANPILVAAFFGSASSLEISAPVVGVLLVLAVGVVCGAWLTLRKQARQLPVVAAAACAVLSVSLAVPVVLMGTPLTPSLVSARLELAGPTVAGRFPAVAASLDVEVPMRGEYRLETSINGVEARPLEVACAPGARTVKVVLAAQDFRRAVLQADGLLGGDSVLRTRLLVRVEGEGFRPVRVTETTVPRDSVEPILRALQRG